MNYEETLALLVKRLMEVQECTAEDEDVQIVIAQALREQEKLGVDRHTQLIALISKDEHELANIAHSSFILGYVIGKAPELIGSLNNRNTALAFRYL